MPSLYFQEKQEQIRLEDSPVGEIIPILKGGSLIVLAGDSQAGKSLLSADIGKHFVEQGGEWLIVCTRDTELYDNSLGYLPPVLKEKVSILKVESARQLLVFLREIFSSLNSKLMLIIDDVFSLGFTDLEVTQVYKLLKMSMSNNKFALITTQTRIWNGVHLTPAHKLAETITNKLLIFNKLDEDTIEITDIKNNCTIKLDISRLTGILNTKRNND